MQSSSYRVDKSNIIGRRITLVIPSLGPGGAEKVMSILATGLVKSGSVVTLITIDGYRTGDFFTVSPEVSRVKLGISGQSNGIVKAIISNAERIHVLRKAIKNTNPEIVISFLSETNILSLLAMRKSRIPVLVSEHTDPFRCPLSWPWSILRNLSYRWADALVVPNSQIGKYFSPLLKDKVNVIGNPVVPTRDRKSEKQQNDNKKKIVSIGRMTEEKRHELLVTSFAKVVKEFPDWRLIIIGDGPLKSDLEQLRDAFGLNSQIELPGIIEEPWVFLAHEAEIFVLSSSYEGFPMALCEAMSEGLAVISTRYHSGVNELIEEGKNGLLTAVNDSNALADQIRFLITHPDERNDMGRKAREITKKFGTRSILVKWNHLIESTLRFNNYTLEVRAGDRFEFGKNWHIFLSKIDTERIEQAQNSIKESLGVESLQGLNFLDIGSGSGLFSLAARQLGAKVHSFDYDPKSVECNIQLKHSYFNGDENWTIARSSVLDRNYLNTLGQFEVVYSWGVLHHTGAMWEALENVSELVKPGGKVFISIYNYQVYWTRLNTIIKRVYNKSPRIGKGLIAGVYISLQIIKGLVKDLICLRNPTQRYIDKKKSRGMSTWHDSIDWIGGYPFETAKPEQIFYFYCKRGFNLRKLTTVGAGHGCNEYVFQKTLVTSE